MRVEFLGHGLHKDHTNTVGHYLVDSFKNDDYHSFIGFSAFTKMSGINRIKKELLIASKNFKSLKFYLGIVKKGTSREALQFLLEHEIETWIFCTEDQIMFHPKIYFFKGKHNYRFITGSSNLTSFGLFDNIEASTFFEFSKANQSGKKLVRQFEEYFGSILNGTDKNVQRLTVDVLKDLEHAGFIWPESQTRDDFEYVKSNKETFAKRKKLKFDKGSLGKIESKPPSNNNDSDYIPAITQEYLNSWPDFFELFKEFKKENREKGDKYSVVVPRDYKNPSLYNWYLKQKIYFKNKILPTEHEELLKKEHFYFGDAHKLWQEWKDDTKLKLLQQAVDEGENIGLSQRYEFKGVRLGTWIQGIKKANKSGKKLDVIERINDIFDLSSKNRTPVDSANRFVSDLLDSENPDKGKWQSRFNSLIRDRVDELPDDVQQDIVDAWYLVFDEIRPLGRIREKQNDRSEEWKKFRYDKNVNPEGAWSLPESIIGSLYYWIRQKKDVKSRMDLIKKNFNELEKSELRREGFPI
jgi:HKD family nuclease